MSLDTTTAPETIPPEDVDVAFPDQDPPSNQPEDPTPPAKLERSNNILLPRNLAVLTKLCSKESPRWATTAIMVKRTDDGYEVAATNGRVAGIVTGTSDDANDFPNIPGIESAPNGEATALVQAAAFAAALKAIPKRTYKAILDNAICVLGKNETTMGSTNLEASNVAPIRNVEGRFPPIREVFPIKTPLASLNIDPKLMIDLLSVAKEFTNEEDKCVTLEFHGEEAVTIMHSKNATQKFRGAIMPLSNVPKKTYSTFVVWGDISIILEGEDTAVAQYDFNSQEELDAFSLGLRLAGQWSDYSVFDTYQEAAARIKTVKKEYTPEAAE
jgi:hypothetical protein